MNHLLPASTRCILLGFAWLLLMGSGRAFAPTSSGFATTTLTPLRISSATPLFYRPPSTRSNGALSPFFAPTSSSRNFRSPLPTTHAPDLTATGSGTSAPGPWNLRRQVVAPRSHGARIHATRCVQVGSLDWQHHDYHHHRQLPSSSFSSSTTTALQPRPSWTTRCKSALMTWINAYGELCDRKPLITKAVSAGIISGLGDWMAQSVERALLGSTLPFDWSRSRSFMLMGLILEGPFVHSWYECLYKVAAWLERRFVFFQSEKIQAFLQLVLDQTVGVAIFFPLYFILYEVIASGLAGRAPNMFLVQAKFRDQLLTVIRTQYLVWPPATWVVFRYIPRNLRVFATNLVSMVWNTYLSSQVAASPI